ncbi:MAG TPA: hypothetical protein VGD14_06745 [bacterium]
MSADSRFDHCLHRYDFHPIGTIIGPYCIWVLVHDDTVKLFERAENVEQRA